MRITQRTVQYLNVWNLNVQGWSQTFGIFEKALSLYHESLTNLT